MTLNPGGRFLEDNIFLWVQYNCIWKLTRPKVFFLHFHVKIANIY